MAKTDKTNYTYATGKRRTASARVRLFRGKGESTVNGKPFANYFTGSVKRDIFTKPFKVVDVSDKFYVTIKVAGGGLHGQVEAAAHGIAKALVKVDKDNFRGPLKKAGLLTRDARIRERRKVGTGGKARRAKQSPKR